MKGNHYITFNQLISLVFLSCFPVKQLIQKKNVFTPLTNCIVLFLRTDTIHLVSFMPNPPPKKMQLKLNIKGNIKYKN